MTRVLSFALAAILALSLTACGTEAVQEPVDLTAFAESVITEYGFSDSLELADPADETGKIFLDNFLPGLTDLELEQAVVYLCAFSMNQGEFAVVQAKDKEEAAKVEELFRTRVDTMINGGAFYPGPTQLWTSYSEVASNGCYVMLVVHSRHADIVKDFNALFQAA